MDWSYLKNIIIVLQVHVVFFHSKFYLPHGELHFSAKTDRHNPYHLRPYVSGRIGQLGNFLVEAWSSACQSYPQHNVVADSVYTGEISKLIACVNFKHKMRSSSVRKDYINLFL